MGGAIIQIILLNKTYIAVGCSKAPKQFTRSINVIDEVQLKTIENISRQLTPTTKEIKSYQLIGIWTGFCKQKCFKQVLKEYRGGACLRSAGREFLSVGAATLKDGYLTNVKGVFCGTCRTTSLPDQND